MKINFFGRPAATTTLPAQLSLKYNLNKLVYIRRTSTDKFELEFQQIIKPGDHKDKIELTKKLNYILEKMIKKDPNQWIWSHNRWK